MKKLNEAMLSLSELRELLEHIEAGRCPAAMSGLDGVHRALFAAALHAQTQRPLCVICADEQEAARMADDLRALTRGEVVTLTAREWQLRERVSASHEFEQQRSGALGALAAGKGEVLVATVDALVQRTLPQSAMRDAMLSLKLGGEYDLDEVTAKLVAAG